MKKEIAAKLKHLNDDYEKITGHAFHHLFKDEETELCKGHIVNQAFRNSSRAWTIQRKDVDGFYGQNFESDFVYVGYKVEKLTPFDAIASSDFSKKLKPKILVDDQPVNYFYSKSNNQSGFTRIEIENNSKHPKDVESALDQNWEIEINTDLRLSALVSLIKSAHLTLFEILGYFYASSLGGYFIGRQILGEFFLQNQDKKSKTEILENANLFFQEFINMVRPVESFAFDIKGTITDKLLFVCKRNGIFWAFIVFVRTSKKLHAVMVPVFDKPESVVPFLDFLKREKETNLTGNFCRFDKPNGQWGIDKTSHNLIWPRSGFSND
jgi:hypothetical protein